MIETWHSILDYRGVLRDEGARISAAEDVRSPTWSRLRASSRSHHIASPRRAPGGACPQTALPHTACGRSPVLVPLRPCPRVH